MASLTGLRIVIVATVAKKKVVRKKYGSSRAHIRTTKPCIECPQELFTMMLFETVVEPGVHPLPPYTINPTRLAASTLLEMTALHA